MIKTPAGYHDFFFLLSPASCMCQPGTQPVSRQSIFSLIFFVQQEPEPEPEPEPRARIRFWFFLGQNDTVPAVPQHCSSLQQNKRHKKQKLIIVCLKNFHFHPLHQFCFMTGSMSFLCQMSQDVNAVKHMKTRLWNGLSYPSYPSKYFTLKDYTMWTHSMNTTE